MMKMEELSDALSLKGRAIPSLMKELLLKVTLRGNAAVMFLKSKNIAASASPKIINRIMIKLHCTYISL